MVKFYQYEGTQSLFQYAYAYWGEKNISEKIDTVGMYIENYNFVTTSLMRARDMTDVYQTMYCLYRFISGKTAGQAYKELLLYLFNDEVQSGAFDVMEGLMSNYAALKESPLIKKMQAMCASAMSVATLEKHGVSIKMKEWITIFTDATKSVATNVDFMASVVDMVRFVLERAIQCWKLGSLRPFLHSSRTYGKWAEDSYEILEIAKYTANLEAVNWTLPKFLTTLDSLIATGEEISAFSKSADTKNLVGPLLLKIKAAKNDFLITAAAGERRRAPYTVLLNGGSSIGKSSVAKIIFAHLAKVLRLPEGDEYVYTRSPGSDFYDGFTTQQIYIMLDDMGFLNPNKAMSDETVNQCLQIINSICFCPPQAELEKKGKTPMRPEIVIGTTNTKHLNAQFYYENWVAVLRRFEDRLDVRPKPQYARDDAPSMLDASKVPTPNGDEYQDIWLYTHVRVLVEDLGKKQVTKELTVAEYSNVYDMLDAISQCAKRHRSQQQFLVGCDKLLREVKLCMICERPRNRCKCLTQTGEVVEYIYKSFTLFVLTCATLTYMVSIFERACNRLAVGYEAKLKTLAKQALSDVVASDSTKSALKTVAANALQDDRTKEMLTNVAKDVIGSDSAKETLSHVATTAVSRTVSNTKASIKAAVVGNAPSLPTFTSAKEALKAKFEALGQLVQHSHAPWVAGLISALVTVGGLFVAYRHFQKDMKEVQTVDTSSAIFSVGTVPVNRDDAKASPYQHKSDFHVGFDIPEDVRSWKGLERTAVAAKVAKNVYNIAYRRTLNGTHMRTDGRALCLGGHLYVTDSHNIPDSDGEMTLIIEPHDSGLTRNLIKKFSKHDFLRLPDSELVFFQVLDVPVHKNLIGLVAKRGYTTKCEGTIIDRKSDGSLRYVPATKIHMINNYVPQLGKSYDMWKCTSEDFNMGDCGSPLILHTPSGPMIAGLHLIGGKGVGSGCISLDDEHVAAAVKHFGRPIFEPSPPMLQSSVRNVTLGPVHHKSVFRYMESGNLRHYGTTNIPRAMGKSKVTKSVLCDAAVARGYEVKVGPPVMNGWKLWRQAALPIVQQSHLVDEHTFKCCAEAYEQEVWDGLSETDRKDLVNSIDLDTAINGIDGFQYLDGIKRSTSAGFPWNKSKKYMMVPNPTEAHPEGVMFNQEALDRIGEMHERYLRHERVSPVFTAHKKDAPLEHAKIAEEKTRIMCGAPVDWSVLVRMFFMPCVWVMMRNKFLFEAMPGLVAQCHEWQDLYKYLTKHGKKRLIAGDYKAYDKNMCAMLILYAFSILIGLCRRAGASENRILVMWGIAEDTAFAFMNFNGDLVEFFGSNPSGHPLTVIINCIVGSLYMRFAFVTLHPRQSDHMMTRLKDFRICVNLATYGDDMAAGSGAAWFNHSDIALVLKDIGIVYTMADKSSESVPFLDISQITFLKRSWRYEPELDAHVAPLDEDSIHKMLTTWIPSDSVSAYAQGEAVISTAVREYFWYGREVFEERSKVLKEIMAESCPPEYVEKHTFPSWETCIAAYRAGGVGFYLAESTTIEGVVQAEESRKSPSARQGKAPKWEASAGTSQPKNRFTQQLRRTKTSLKFCESGLRGSRMRSEPSLRYLAQGERRDTQQTDPRRTMSVVRREKALANQTHDQNTYVSDHFPQGSIQSEELPAGSYKITNQQNLQFVDAGHGVTFDAPALPTYAPDSDGAAGLGDFLSRPVLINTFNWAETDTALFVQQFQPWKLYFNDSNIKKKLDNYARIRCRLHLKFVLNASPFYFGSIRACYTPLNDGREIAKFNAQLTQQVMLSQTPGVFLEPARSTSEELVLPFIWPKNWLDAAEPLDFDNMGTITYELYAQLRSANGVSTANCRISCYAWAEDVEIAGLTTFGALQSDEYAEGAGPISGVATAVADVASVVADVPILGEYARATEMGAKMVAGVASLFGYSNTPVVDDVKPMQNKSFHAFSNSETSMPIDKLTLDPKNEVTIDTSAVGAGSDDPLVITTWGKRESFIQGTAWSQVQGLNAILWTAPVTPVMGQEDFGTYRSTIAHTPAGYISRMFSKWRGAVTYKFRFVKSKYHTGRVLISWDPCGVPSLDSETTTFTRLVDLQTEDEVYVTIPYKASATWSSTRFISNNYSDTIAPSITYDPDAHNGVIQMRVQNTLTGPAANASLDVLVFVRMGDDFELAVPNELPSSYSMFEVQSAEIPEGIVEGSGSPTTSGNASITTGENIVSLRALLHRSSFHMYVPLGDQMSGVTADPMIPTFYVAGPKILTTLVPRIPRGPGYDPEGIHWAVKKMSAGVAPYNYTPMHPLTYVSACFAGYRGSVVHHFNVITQGEDGVESITAENQPTLWTIRATRQGRNRNTIALNNAAPSNMSRAMLGIQDGLIRAETGQRGLSLTNPRTQTALSVVSPQYSSWKFRPSYSADADIFPTGVGNEYSSLRVTARASCGGADGSVAWPQINAYCAAGVDFTPVYFICAPLVYSFALPTANDMYTPA